MKSEIKTSWNRVGIFIGTKYLGYETKRLENRDETLLYETPRDETSRIPEHVVSAPSSIFKSRNHT